LSATGTPPPQAANGASHADAASHGSSKHAGGTSRTEPVNPPPPPRVPERGSSASGGLGSLLGGNGNGSSGNVLDLHTLQAFLATALALMLVRGVAGTDTAIWKSLVVTTCAERPG
jgi:hypothetical protein